VDLGDGGSHVAEIQVHQRDIFENLPDHKPYEFFRALWSTSPTGFQGTLYEWRCGPQDGIMGSQI
jgi:hypothetical protein